MWCHGPFGFARVDSSKNLRPEKKFFFLFFLFSFVFFVFLFFLCSPFFLFFLSSFLVFFFFFLFFPTNKEKGRPPNQKWEPTKKGGETPKQQGNEGAGRRPNQED